MVRTLAAVSTGYCLSLALFMCNFLHVCGSEEMFLCDQSVLTVFRKTDQLSFSILGML